MTPDQVDHLNARMRSYRERVEHAISAEIAVTTDGRQRLFEAMRYGVLNGGKRVRAILVYAAGEALGAPDSSLDVPAVAVELVHAYSLIHDDLPAMDNDDLRRGQPTCHKAFDEATALLAGDALQCLAFEVLAGATGGTPASTCDILSTVRLSLIRFLAQASGAMGMAGGQGIDLAAVGQSISLEELEYMHRHKTGALINAAVQMGACCHADADAGQLARLSEYAGCIGLAFQIRDDVLDVIGDTAVIGKAQGADIARNKPTYPALIGLEASKERARKLHEQAVEALSVFGSEADILRLLSAFIVHREH